MQHRDDSQIQSPEAGGTPALRIWRVSFVLKTVAAVMRALLQDEHLRNNRRAIIE